MTEPLSQEMIDYWHSPARHYVNDAILDGHTMAEAMKIGRQKIERDLAGGNWDVVADVVVGIDEPSPTMPVVYYMRLNDLVKIGTTTNIAQRCESVNTQGVIAIEWGSYRLERERHSQFADLHVHGEWFRLEGRLVDHVVELRRLFEQVEMRTTEQWLAHMGVRS